MDGALFRAVDVSELEAQVLQDAEKRARDATIPKFVSSKGLGFGNSSLGNFCSTADPLVLRMAADEVRREGRALRESGVANLTARDRVSSCTSKYSGYQVHQAVRHSGTSSCNRVV